MALSTVTLLNPWERVLDWQFAKRPGDLPLWHLYLEIMGRYSNAVLVDQSGTIFACGHGVSERQSSVRPVQPGLAYQPPPSLTTPTPTSDEPFEHWLDHIRLIPDKLSKRLLKSYRGISSQLVQSLLSRANIPSNSDTVEVSPEQWQQLYQAWQLWLHQIKTHTYDPGWTSTGYTVLGWTLTQPVDSVHTLLEQYYQTQLNQEQFQQDRHRLLQKLQVTLRKLYQRRDQFEATLHQSAQADDAKRLADLLMAHLSQWSPGLREISLPDFETGQATLIKLDPEKNAVSNAQAYYKKHQKQKRSKAAVLPLYEQVLKEISYLEQVEASLHHLDTYQTSTDLEVLRDIQAELVAQHYLKLSDQPRMGSRPAEINFRRFQSPSGYEIVVGRNNHQNDMLTFRLAQESDWWFHAQEIPGSHVILRLPPGHVAEDEDLQVAADVAARFSRAQWSDKVPVVYTRPQHVYKPKGALPGMVVYKHETIIWAEPNAVTTA